ACGVSVCDGLVINRSGLLNGCASRGRRAAGPRPSVGVTQSQPQLPGGRVVDHEPGATDEACGKILLVGEVAAIGAQAQPPAEAVAGLGGEGGIGVLLDK